MSGSTVRQVRPFSLQGPRSGARGRIFSWIKGPLEKLLYLDDLNRVYAHASPCASRQEFFQRVLERLHTCARVTQADLAEVPRSGPVIVVANHPFGAIEGVILCSLLESIRADVRVMGNYLLQRIPELRELFIAVDPFGGAEAARSNVRGLRQSLDWLGDGGMLAVFPAGTVSHLDIRQRRVTDPVWSDTVARLARRTCASVLPIYFDGANSTLFQIAGLVHPRLRTAMLPREVFNKRRGTINVKIGRAIPFNKLKGFPDDRGMTEYLRRRTYLLRYRDRAGQTALAAPAPVTVTSARMDPIGPAIDPDLLAADVAKLPGDCLMCDGGESKVYLAAADRLPSVLREIGRLREITFRLTGEGTGRSSDLDRFDARYLHLFVWNEKKREIVGSYRLGPTDRVLAGHGTAGLYTSTLFHFKPAMLRKLNPAVELGRSFVRPEYQKSYSPLMLLWKGIGQFLVRNPRYRILFGPVSISNTYNTVSRQLMVAFLKLHNYLPDLARLVKARRPFSTPNANAMAGGDVEEVSDLVSQIESDQKGVPILIKQYLKLGGRMLGFNVDPEFSDVVDGLIYIDLARTERRVLERYMGKEPCAGFLAYRAALAAEAQPI